MAILNAAYSVRPLGSALAISVVCAVGIIVHSAAPAVAIPFCGEPTSGPDEVINSVSIARDRDQIIERSAGEIDFSVDDDAQALSDETNEDHYIYCQSRFAREFGLVELENSASLSLAATAFVDAQAISPTGLAEAESYGGNFNLRGLHQYVGSDEILSIAALINRGSIGLSGSIESHARAAGDVADALATAEADEFSGISQRSISDEGAALSIIGNFGPIDATTFNHAHAQAVGSEAYADAEAVAVDVVGIRQGAASSDGPSNSLIDNQGSVGTSSVADSQSEARGGEARGGEADARATAYSIGVLGIGQTADSSAAASAAVIENTGQVTLDVDSIAKVSARSDSGPGASVAVAGVGAATAMAQASGSDDGDTLASIGNEGRIAVRLSASGRSEFAGSTGLSVSLAGIQDAGGIDQLATTLAGTEAEATIDNSGLLTVDASVDATGVVNGTDSLSGALGLASDVFGIRQIVEGDRGLAAIYNTGLIWVSGDVRAQGRDGAFAQSSMAGIAQEGAGYSDRLLLRNAGRIFVETDSEAVSDRTAIAVAQGVGILQSLDYGVVQVENAGSVLVDAVARVDGPAVDLRHALAESAGLVIEGGDAVDGSEIRNTGDMVVSATAPDGEAAARGIYVDLDWFAGEIRNLGTNARLETHAIGAESDSVAIGFADGTEIGPGTVIENDSGRIVAGRSDRTGDPLRHGIAISLIDSDGHSLPGAPATIRLRGSDGAGTVFGKINIRPEDRIAVTDGVTVFNGVVNNPVRRGTMAIGDGGVFVLARDAVNGAAQVNVDRFEQAADGTLVFELGASPGRNVAAGPPGNGIGQINANTVILDGAMALRLTDGLYDDVVTYQDIVTATQSIDGEWSTITVSSPLFSARSIAAGRSGRSLGLRLDRTPFGDVGGLTRNQRSAGRGIEGSYDALLAGRHAGSDYAAMVQTLFSLDADQYRAVMEDLHGAQYAQGLGSITASLDLLGRTVSSRLDGGGLNAARFDQDNFADLGGTNRDGLSAMWIAPQGAWSDVSGDVEAAGFQQTETAVHAGVDHQFTPEIRAGLVAGYFSAALGFDDDGGPLNYGGTQAGVFGQIDRGAAYLRGLASYGRYRGEARRFVDVGSAQGALAGDFDADAWRAEVEAGHDLAVADGLTITPYAGLAFAAGRYQAFQERDDGTGAALSISGGSETVTSALGLRFEERVDWGGGRSLRLGGHVSWLRDVTGTPARFDAAFAGIGDSAFSVRGSDRSPDSAAIDLDLSWTWSDRASGGAIADIGAGYRGRFNADATTHGLSARATLRF